ncbi:crotonase/enoyl-CoA hydratase family protein [Halomonas campisalis]|uniref:Crotonase/enoyl-CoA hydratase family protein n=1 Tax=Billgrantia campisalis TaxID=74661 RepID=A0ABS9P750_9GAMM|nr:crotonase/enoyl-CoA hydratase family protein [Halomonas campisalis]MCG6657603.1 crotonase/enoyl-CoA hydratase family protein [Halomonas campisalis]MDR5862624.1 crotonase/enoyl-CoA hydratase family protein [Halomonas campisalis]
MTISKRFYERVTLEIENGVAEVGLARPDRHNGLDWAMIDGLLAAQRHLAELAGRQPGQLRAVVLVGEGESFCAGLDMAAIMAQPERLPGLLEAAEDGINPVQRLALGWRDAGVPVIAALHGHVYGGGLQIALGADIRVVHPQARLALLEIAWGIIPDMAISVTGADIRGDVLRELAWTGRKVSGEEAVTLGLATRLSQAPRDTAREIATAIAGHSPRAVAAAAALFAQAPGLDARARLALEARLQGELLGGAEQQEAMAARLTGRAARFPPA